MEQYINLSNIHDKRDKDVSTLRATEGIDKGALNKKIDYRKMHSKEEIYELHALYIGKLSAKLTDEQISKVKDGMTYNVIPRIYMVYLEMLPELTDEQKRIIKAYLVEARELAIDMGTSEKKHWVFGKYKGKINNYLSKADYNLKQAEKEMYERKKTELKH